MRKLFTLFFLLAAFTVYAAESDNKSDGKVMQTMYNMTVIEKQLEAYKKENGKYPENKVEFNNIKKYNVIVVPDHTIQNRFMEGNSPYADKGKWRGYKFARPDLVDGWGRDYEYISNGVKYSIRSHGEDGKQGGTGAAADIIIYKSN